jgi:uncharacterized membrane protein (DUF4010 family)
VLLAMTVIALPVVPDVAIGPRDSLNPREIWLIAIALAGVSFLGYAAVKYFGKARGILLAGALGGLVSSTAVTISNARRASENAAFSHMLAAGVAAASAVMFLRVLVLAGVLNQTLLPSLAPPLAAASLAAVVFALAVIYRLGDDRETEEVIFRNPFGFWSVIGFALFLAAVIVIGRLLGEQFGTAGAMIGAAIAGLVDVDAITVSMARLVPEPLGARSAALAILTATATDTLSKVIIGIAAGGRRFAGYVATMAIGCFLSGGVVFWLLLALAQ